MSADEIRTQVEEWINTVGTQMQNLTEQNRNLIPNLDFLYQVGVVVFSLLTNRLDRVNVFAQVGLSPEHQEAISHLQGVELGKFMEEIITPAHFVGLSLSFLPDQQNPNRVSMIKIWGWIDTESMNREQFFKLWDKVAHLEHDTIRRIQNQFSPGSINLGNQATDSGVTPGVS